MVSSSLSWILSAPQRRSPCPVFRSKMKLPPDTMAWYALRKHPASVSMSARWFIEFAGGDGEADWPVNSKLGSIALKKARLARLNITGCVLTGIFEHRRGKVDPDYLVPVGKEMQCQVPGTAADIQQHAIIILPDNGGFIICADAGGDGAGEIAKTQIINFGKSRTVCLHECLHRRVFTRFHLADRSPNQTGLPSCSRNYKQFFEPLSHHCNSRARIYRANFPGGDILGKGVG